MAEEYARSQAQIARRNCEELCRWGPEIGGRTRERTNCHNPYFSSVPPTHAAHVRLPCGCHAIVFQIY